MDRCVLHRVWHPRECLRVFLMLTATVAVETTAAALATLFITHPAGSITIRACPVRFLSDWYTVFHNPSINYERTINCTHEDVSPLYSMVFLYLALSFVAMAIGRSCLVMFWLRRERIEKSSHPNGKRAPESLVSDCVIMTVYATCLLYTSPSPRDKRQSRMPSSA